MRAMNVTAPSTNWPCGLGGVIFVDGKSFVFSVDVDVVLPELLGEKVKKQIIFEAKTLRALGN